jgi:hypothetical protein
MSLLTLEVLLSGGVSTKNPHNSWIKSKPNFF